MTHIEEFREAMRAAGLAYDGPIADDGKRRRFKPGEDKDDSGWFILFPPNPIAAGAFGCWRRQIKEKWCHKNGKRPSNEEMAVLQRQWKEVEAQRERDDQERYARMAGRAKELVEASEKPNLTHAYLESKKVRAYGDLRETIDGDLLLPLVDAAGKMWSVQTIDAIGDKLFMPGGRVAGCMFWVRKRNSGPLLICEGYATGASLFEATGFAVCCALNCGNLLTVARELRKAMPLREILICADNDWKTEGNPGLTKGDEAAKAVGGRLVSPQFPPGMDVPRTDFNDLHVAGGLVEVKAQILLALEYPMARPIGDLQPPVKDDPDELLKHRYICRGGGLLVVGPTGIGKSSFALQMLALWANGMSAFGIEPTRPLRSIYIQAENDDGDIAEIRDGIAKGLDFDAGKRMAFFERVIVHSENVNVSRKFFDDVVIPLIVSNPGLDLIVIDPAFSYIGDEAGKQKAVSEFLRQMLTPILCQHRLGAIIVHHSNKPASGAQKPEWTNAEMAYLGSGSIEWANWSRAVLALQGTKVNGVFKLNAAKRGARLAWKEEATGERSYHQMIKHFKSDKVICWLPATEEDAEATSGEGGRPPKAELDDFVSLIKHTPLSSGQWLKYAKEELGISRATFYRLAKIAEEEGRVLQSKVNEKWTYINQENGQ